MKMLKKTLAPVLVMGMLLTVVLAVSGCKKDKADASASAEHPSVEKAAEHPAADEVKEHPAADKAKEHPVANKPKDHPAH